MKQVITGTFAELESVLIKILAERETKKSLAPLLLLVSEHPISLYIHRKICQKLTGFCNIYIRTLPEFAGDICASNVEICPQLIPPFVQNFLLREILGKEPPDGGFSQNIGSTLQSAESLRRAIGELKRAAISPEILAATGQKSTKLARLTHLYQSYEETLQTIHAYDREGMLQRATQLLPRSEISARFPKIFLYGFYRIDPLERRFLASLCQAKSCLSFVPFRSFPSFSPLRELLQWHQQLGFVGKSAPSDRTRQRKRWQNIHNHLSSFDEKKNPTVGAIAIETTTPAVEAETIASFLFERATQDIPFSSMAIVLPPNHRHRYCLRNTLEARNIPTELWDLPLQQSPQADFLLRFFTVVCQDIGREAVLELCRSPVFDPCKIIPEDLHEGISRQLWEYAMVELGILQSEQWKVLKDVWLLEHLASRWDENWEIIAKALYIFADFLRESKEALQQAKNYRELVQKSFAICQKISLPSAMYSHLENEISPLYTLDNFAAPSLTDYRELVHAALQALLLPKSPPEGVVITTLDMVIGQQFSVVVFSAMDEGFFRSNTPLLLSDREIFCLNQDLEAQQALPQVPLRNPDEDRLLFSLAIDSSLQYTAFTFFSEDGWGRNFLPATLFTELSNCSSEHIKANSRRMIQPILSPLVYDLALLQKAIEGEQNCQDALFQEHPRWQKTLQRMRFHWGQPGFTKHDGMIRSSDLTKLLEQQYSLASPSPIAANSLETYARCPYQFFLQHVLTISPRPTAREIATFSKTMRLSWIAKIIRAFFAEADATLPPEDIPEVLYRVSTPLWDENPPFLPLGQEMLWEIERQRLIEIAEQYLQKIRTDERGSGGKKSLRYGKTGTVTVSPTPNKTLRFTGKVDYCYRRENAISAVELRYGSGTKTQNNRFYGGERLQLAVHLLALKNLFREDFPEQVEYRYLRENGEYRSVSFDTNQWPQTKDLLERICYAILQGVESGFFFAVPEAQKCRNCPYIDVCGPSREILFQCKQDDPRTALYRELKSIF